MIRELEWFEVEQKTINLRNIHEIAYSKFGTTWNWAYNEFLIDNDLVLFKMRIQYSLIRINEMINFHINDKFKTTNLGTCDRIPLINSNKEKNAKYKDHYTCYKAVISETNFCSLGMIENVFSACLDKQNKNNRNFATYFCGAIQNFIGNILNKTKGKKYQYFAKQKIMYFDKEEEKKIIEQHSNSCFSDEVDFNIWLQQFEDTLCEEEAKVFKTLKDERFKCDKERSRYLEMQERTFRRRKQSIKQQWANFQQAEMNYMIS